MLVSWLAPALPEQDGNTRKKHKEGKDDYGSTLERQRQDCEDCYCRRNRRRQQRRSLQQRRPVMPSTVHSALLVSANLSPVALAFTLIRPN